MMIPFPTHMESHNPVMFQTTNQNSDAIDDCSGIQTLELETSETDQGVVRDDHNTLKKNVCLVYVNTQ